MYARNMRRDCFFDEWFSCDIWHGKLHILDRDQKAWLVLAPLAWTVKKRYKSVTMQLSQKENGYRGSHKECQRSMPGKMQAHLQEILQPFQYRGALQ